MSRRDPLSPHELGRWGEARAARELERRGWTVLERNYRLHRNEIDLVVRRGAVVAFVEVKTRMGEGFGGPEGAVTRKKRREIERVAHSFLHRSGLEDVEVRMDVVGIVVDRHGRLRRFTHTPDAWRPRS